MQIIDAKGIKIQEAEVKSGLGATTLQKLKTRNEGKGKLHKDNLEKFLRTFHVERSWWDTGEGDMFEKSSTSNSEPLKTMPLDVWIRLERNFENFVKNEETFRQVIANEDAKMNRLLDIIRDMTTGRIESHKI